MAEILRTDCAKCKYAPAVVLIKAKLYCSKCAIDVHYHWNKNRKTEKSTKEEK